MLVLPSMVNLSLLLGFLSVLFRVLPWLMLLLFFPTWLILLLSCPTVCLKWEE